MLIGQQGDFAEIQARFRRFAEVDWDFTAQASESPFSSVHWHPCRFPSQVPALMLGRMTAPGHLILDPFMGSATTLVEAQRLNRKAIGIDVNPVSCLLARAKTLRISSREVDAIVDSIRIQLASDWKQIQEAVVPLTVQHDKWYMPSTLSDLRRLWTLKSASEGDAATIFLACFSAILLSNSREDRHWGYICDNTAPKGERAPNAKELFLVALKRLGRAYSLRQMESDTGFEPVDVVRGDALTSMASMADESIDCVVTSPPYFGVADYVKAQRLTMEWLSEDIEPLRQQEIGARSKRHRRSALADYLTETKLVFAEVFRILKKGSAALIVFGQSPSRPDAQEGFLDCLRTIDFDIMFQRERNIAIGRRQKPSLVLETILLVRK